MQKLPAIILDFKSLRTLSSWISILGQKSFASLVGMKNTYPKSTPSWNSIISNHIGNERLDDARRVFDKIPSPDVYLYTIMITGYSRMNRINEALQMFYKMPTRDVVSWNSMIKGCVDCGKLDIARRIFDEMPERNCVSWTTIVDGFARFGRIEVAEELFYKMPSRDAAAWNSMIFGYCSNGRIEDACKLFEKMPHPNVISWTTMISGLDQCGDRDKALVFFQQMQVSGVEPTSSTFACVVTACANIPALDQGIQLHAHLVKVGDVFDTFVSTSLITLYANCKRIENSFKLFEENKNRNVVVWTALLTGYGSNDKHESALEVFCNMTKVRIKPNQSTFTSVLNSCCRLEALDRGKAVHTKTIKAGLDLEVFVGNSLIVMYTKCGNISDGAIVFNSMSKRNLVSWNAIIVGCAQHGYGQLALEFFDHMVHAAVRPDEITFVGLLTACSHCRMLEKGQHFFELLNQDPSVDVRLEHYACMVDVLGRSGHLEEAEEFIKNMPMSPNSMIWLALLGACKVHSHLEVGRRAAKQLFHLEPHSSAAYILLSNIYASSGRWNDVSRIRAMMKERGIIKTPGCSWITLKWSRHEFLSGDRSHPMSKQIYEKLDFLSGKLKELGYVPDKQFVLHDVEDEQKEAMLAYHSERLAIGFGLVSTAEGSAITVIKNLRICGDCHCAIKLISKIVGREIVVRDSNRFHHFRNETCSCGDYW
ncbi:pentatricopeptide repeat-containing protein At5g46460, mitochondrial-like [Magnolia sinica]|uniref:pentatricopeptide repeat-containing protein At5g46460, mitochondrial-like n=1 Tax=Magnolia sinica TaxID=86752 RepID=UPI00265A52E8|nr:pentatricopeptide repeat-containing protein At5g46460, mitochondrial-like [Magnolia sinica]